jgi:hypothetical protein
MSYWTSVEGNIEVKYTVTSKEELNKYLKDLKQRLGKPFFMPKDVDYTNKEQIKQIDKERKECIVPMSSENSLYYEINKVFYKVKDYKIMYWFVINIYGNLRDYTGYEKIYLWIKNACEGLNVRKCAIDIQVSETDKNYLIYNKGNKILLYKRKI